MRAEKNHAARYTVKSDRAGIGTLRNFVPSLSFAMGAAAIVVTTTWNRAARRQFQLSIRVISHGKARMASVLESVREQRNDFTGRLD